MIKHCLTDWPGLAGPKKSWWYKLQLFDGRHHRGSLLYLDLDVVLVRDLSWVRALDTNYVWGIRDFRHLQRPGLGGMNSSMMWFDTQKFGWIWDNVARLDIMEVARRHRGGDQEYIYTQLDVNQRRFFDDRYFQSYRWQVQDGGYDFARRQHLRPGSGTAIAADTAVIVFHGHPKPHEVTDPQIQQLWNPVDQ
jgi:lipopolysaccharide biosynthesis glycosyltransferase